jgi:uncharacterized protein YdeI (YjbR/CyaY-like superfamily)
MVKTDPRIDAYIAGAADFAKPILIYLREVVHAACPDVEETVKWRLPTFTRNGILCSMAAFKHHAAFNLWKGGHIVGGEVDPAAMGQFGRITKISDLPSKKVLTGYIRQVAALNDARGKAPKPRTESVRRKPLPATPADLAAELQKNAKARATFDGFSPSHRREYIEWIVEAKREETRRRRLAQAVGMLAEGKTRNWKYS